MSLTKWNSAARRAFLGVAVLLTASTVAHADSVTLVCTNDERPSDPPFKIELDPAHAAVTIVLTAQQYMRASTTTYPATFTPQEIKFATGSAPYRWYDTIDRLTGVITIVAEGDQSVVLHNHCHVGTAQF